MKQHALSGDRSCGARGAALVLSLFAVVVVAGMTMAFLRLGMSTTSEQLQLLDDERAMAVAEAGLAEGLYAMIEGDTGNVGSAAAPAAFGDGLFWVEATPFPNGRTGLTATAMVGKGRAVLSEVWGENASNRMFGGVMSETDIFIKSSAIVDSFDSTLGSYADQLPAGAEYLGQETSVMANGSIFFGSNGEVYGDVWAGYGFDAEIPNISGDLTQLRRPFELDPVEVPPIPIGPALHVSADTVLPPGDYGVADLLMDQEVTLTIRGPARIVIDDAFLMENKSVLLIDASNGPVEVYSTANVVLDTHSIITTLAENPHDVTLNITGSPGDFVALDNHSTFYGTVYAPGIDLEIGTEWELFGAVAAGRITANPHAKIHTDTSLFDRGSRFTYTHQVWYEDAISNPAWMQSRRDPFRLLGLDRTALPKPDDAHDTYIPPLGGALDGTTGGTPGGTTDPTLDPTLTPTKKVAPGQAKK